MNKPAKKDVLVLIDGNALIHRGFHALPPLTTKDGELVNAVFGFTTTLLKVLSEIKPKYIAVTFDKKKKTFRHEKYKEYKAKRIKAPQELYDQIPLVKQIVEAFNIPIFEKDGFEADDLIGTLAYKTDKDVLIVTSDLDAYQLINGHVKVYKLKHGFKTTEIIGRAEVEQELGLSPEQVVDFKALRGDASDNIPGVKGIGEKTAVRLLIECESVENLYKLLHEHAALSASEFEELLTKQGYSAAFIKAIKGKNRERLIAEEHMAQLSKELATIVRDVDIEFDLAACETADFEREKVLHLFGTFGFRSLIRRIPESKNVVDINGVSHNKQGSLFAGPATQSQQKEDEKADDKRTKQQGVTYRTIQSQEELQQLIQLLKNTKEFAIDTETERLDHVHPVMVGISISTKTGEGWYIPVGHTTGKQLNKKIVLDALRPILQDESIKKIGHNIKYDYVVFLENDIEMKGMWCDTMIAYYLGDTGTRNYALSDLALSELGYVMQPITDLIGKHSPKAATQKLFSETSIEDATFYACEDADITWQLYKHIIKKITELKLEGVLHDIEMALIPTLARMERAGVKIDKAFLEELSRTYRARIAKLETSIYEFAGTKFNINSPQQLSGILFDQLKLPRDLIKKTKTGHSTAASELEKLRGKHDIIDALTQYRELEKLRNTYIDSLPLLVRPDTNRIHTSFNQTIAATGRLSSTDPNLQNIPIRTDQGREIRKAFIPDKGNRILALDYSQIELRIAAHMSGDTNLIAAFNNGEDIHRTTAAKIFNTPDHSVTYDMRRAAKAVNFGIIYGISAFGLSQNLRIEIDKAQEIIDAYFLTYPKLKQFMENVVEEAKVTGYVETLLGRKRFIPELQAGNWQLKQAGKRMAINMPIQGTQADIIKMAMIKIDDMIQQEPGIRMILQVHDELVFEVREQLVESCAKDVKSIMESIYTISVPLNVEAKVGKNWGELTELKI
jgi:DNA polymerase I